MVLTKDAYMNLLKTLVGENPTDEQIKFLEDMTDTYNDLESKGSVDWEKKYNENDAAWRQRYRDRFFGGSENLPPVSDLPVDTPSQPAAEPDEPNPENTTIDSLFTAEVTPNA